MVNRSVASRCVAALGAMIRAGLLPGTNFYTHIQIKDAIAPMSFTYGAAVALTA